MSSERDRQLRRERKQVERRRAAQEVGAKQTQQQQAIAAAQLEFAERRRRHLIAYALWTVAFVMAVAHGFEHLGTFKLMSQGLEDLLLGWPMAGALGIVGGIVYGT